MTVHFEAAKTLIETAGVDMNTLACTGRAQAATIISSKVLAGVVLPQSLRIVNSAEEADAAIDRLATDDAAVITALRGLALYLQARFADETFDPETLQEFMDQYTAADDETRRVAVEGTLRILDEVLDAETRRCAPEGTDLSEFDGKFDKFLEDMKEAPIEVLLENFEPVVTFLIQMANLIVKGDEKGQSVEECRDENRIAGQFMSMMYEMMLQGVTGAMLRAVLKVKLNTEQFDQVEALLEKQKLADESEDGEAVLH